MVDFDETPNIYPNLSVPLNVPLSDQEHFRLNKINEIKNYFAAQITERGLISKRFSKYVASFDYFDKSLIVLSVTTGSIQIASFESVIAAPVRITSASFSLAYSICARMAKKLLKTSKSKKKKHIIFMLPRTKLNSIESKISEALVNNEISHEDFMKIINEDEKYRELKESIRMVNS